MTWIYILFTLNLTSVVLLIRGPGVVHGWRLPNNCRIN